jgi:hypothetical protein
MAQAVEHLPSKRESLRSNPSAGKKKKDDREEKAKACQPARKLLKQPRTETMEATTHPRGSRGGEDV